MILELRPYQKIISLLIMLLCGILCITYERTAFATLANRPGFYGNLHVYYNVGRIMFGMYNLIIGLISFVVIILQFKSIAKNNKAIFKRGCWIFLALAVLLIIAETYLQMSFKGKG